MKLKSDLDRTYSVQPMDYIRANDNKSKGHLRARVLLKKLFGTEWLLEEVPAKIYKSTLYVDFLLPQSKIVVEVQGEQHTKFVEFFHETKAEFQKAQKRDLVKEVWCELNQLKLVQLPYNESDEEWMKRILA